MPRADGHPPPQFVSEVLEHAITGSCWEPGRSLRITTATRFEGVTDSRIHSRNATRSSWAAQNPFSVAKDCSQERSACESRSYVRCRLGDRAWLGMQGVVTAVQKCPQPVFQRNSHDINDWALRFCRRRICLLLFSDSRIAVIFLSPIGILPVVLLEYTDSLVEVVWIDRPLSRH
jgi:hypothetical protein